PWRNAKTTKAPTASRPAQPNSCDRVMAVPPSRPHPLAAAAVELDRAVGDDDAKGRADGAFDQADLAARGAHQLGDDGEPGPDAAGAGRALERLEQVRARPLAEPGAGVGHLDHHHRALAPAGDAHLVAAGIARVTALERLHRVAREVE